MEIIVEIGTDEQKERIYKELSIIDQIAKSLSIPPEAIPKVIVPENFDETINSFTKLNRQYKSQRGHLAIAKNLPLEDGTVLVFSPLLYTSEFDGFMRMQIYSHEVLHVDSKFLFPKIPNDSMADFEYFTQFYRLFDEYYANRMSYEITEDFFEKLSFKYRKHNAAHLKGFIESITENDELFNNIQREIFEFRIHSDLNFFLNNFWKFFETASLSFVYIYSMFDHNPKLKRLEPILTKSPFFDDDVKSLMEYFRTKFEEGNYNFFNDKELIVNFIMNFGLEFECFGKDKYYCHVLDI